MDSETPLYERRRYSAIAFTHPAIQSYSDFENRTEKYVCQPTRLNTSIDDWDLRRVEVLGPKSHYPLDDDRRGTLRRDGGFAHESYVGIRPSRVLENPIVMIATPYKQLLVHAVRQLSEVVTESSLWFVALRMAQVFDYLTTERDAFRATRIAVQTAGEPGVSLVSLSGVSPLQSGLWTEIRKSVTPYGVRIEHKMNDRSVRFHADRLGNYFWYQLDEVSATLAYDSLGRLVERGLARSVTLSPLRRRDSAGDDEDG